MTQQPAMSAMARETLETPEVLARFLDRERRTVADLGVRLRELSPPVLVTCARGSSDHVAAYGKYLAEILTGTPVASVGPSVASIYGAQLRLAGSAILSVSQSGKSPDIVALQASARRSGALAIAVVNVASSPLAAEADIVVPIHAGPERSVAATKTFLASAFAIAAVAAAWSGDEALKRAIDAFPEVLGRALALDWSIALDALTSARSVYVIARGPAYPIAQEAALKLKETSMLHAEAYSGAEVLHGPLQLIEPGFPVVAFRPDDASRDAMGETLSRIAATGGRVFSAESGPSGTGRLPIAPSGHPFLDSLSMPATFYILAEATARARGLDPDRPTSLSKVTETV